MIFITSVKQKAVLRTKYYIFVKLWRYGCFTDVCHVRSFLNCVTLKHIVNNKNTINWTRSLHFQNQNNYNLNILPLLPVFRLEALWSWNAIYASINFLKIIHKQHDDFLAMLQYSHIVLLNTFEGKRCEL